MQTVLVTRRFTKPSYVKSEQKRPGFFLAMAHWQLGEKDKAREWFAKSVQWMEKGAKDEELRRFRVEAAELLGIKEGPRPEPTKVHSPKM